MIILMPSQLVFLQLHNTLRQDTSPSQVSTVVKPSDCLVHRSWNIFGVNRIEDVEDGSGDDACGGVGDDDGDVGDDDGDGRFLVERQSCKRTVAWLQRQKSRKSKKQMA